MTDTRTGVDMAAENARLRADLTAARERMERVCGEFVARMTAECADFLNLLGGHPDGPVAPDPLAAYRFPSGDVCWVQAYADEVRVGDWVQRCHGDPDWHRVEDVAVLNVPVGVIGTLPTRRITYDGTAHDWAPRDVLRVAAFPTRASA